MPHIDLHTCAFYSYLYHNRLIKPREKIAHLHTLQGAYPTTPHNTLPLRRLLHWLSASSDHHMITYDDPRYPMTLKRISAPPIILFCMGQLDLLARHSIAIVGSRQATDYGIKTAHRFAAALGQVDFTIVSGLAQGIDTAAAQGAISTPGSTIAVLGTGIDLTYPASNQHLQQRIAQQGLVISEFWPGTRPHAKQFPQRNRIISALSIATSAVEAAYPSGSLITARYALEQNKAVFAVPGPIYNQAHTGTHWLIQQGADLLQHPNDILRSIAPYTRPSPRSLAQLIMWSLLVRPSSLHALQRRFPHAHQDIPSTLLTLQHYQLISYDQKRYHCSHFYIKK